MKKIFYSIGLVALSSLFSDLKTIDENADYYKWTEIVKPGNGSFQENWEAGKWPMAISPVQAFENKLWMIGYKNCWSSGNGINWEVHKKTNWGERHGMTFTFFKNKLWMMGGMRTWDDFRNDIWHTADGKKWEQVVANAKWSKRRGHYVVVFKNKLWLIGGAISSGKADQTPTKFLNDVWSSEDGINWILESNAAPWQGGDGIQIFVFNEKLWMINTIKREIWNSSDGKIWKLISNKTPWKERRGNGLVIFNNNIWIFGGIELNDVWCSADGMQWQQLGNAPWSTRSAQYSISYKNKLWLFSGKTGREDSWAGDIWTLEYKSSNQ